MLFKILQKVLKHFKEEEVNVYNPVKADPGSIMNNVKDAVIGDNSVWALPKMEMGSIGRRPRTGMAGLSKPYMRKQKIIQN